MASRGEWAHLGGRVEWVAEPDGLGELDELPQEVAGDRLVEYQTRAGDAGLALVVEDRECGTVDGSLDVGIGEDDVGPLAAELELDALQVAGGSLNDRPPDGGRASKGDLANVWVAGQVLAGGPPRPRNDVDDAGRDAGLTHELTDPERAQRRQLGRFHDDGVACCQGRAHLPAAEHQWEVPRDDRPDDTERLADHVVEEARFHRDHVALQLVRYPAEIAKRRGRPDDVEVAAVADRMAGVEALEPGQLVGVRFDQVRKP